MGYSVYAIRLIKSVMNDPKFRRANPDYDPRKPCVYVGSTALTPEQRYCSHLTTMAGSKWVKKFHDGLMEKWTDAEPKYASRESAEIEEFVRAMRLRKRGYGVWTNLPSLPTNYKEARFATLEWSGQPQDFVVITGYTADVDGRTEIQIADYKRKLERMLRSKLITEWLRRIDVYSPTTGRSEDGWAVALSIDQACDIGKHFKHDAIYCIRNGKLYISFCDARRALVKLGIFSERLHVRGDHRTQPSLEP